MFSSRSGLSNIKTETNDKVSSTIQTITKQNKKKFPENCK